MRLHHESPKHVELHLLLLHEVGLDREHHPKEAMQASEGLSQKFFGKENIQHGYSSGCGQRRSLPAPGEIPPQLRLFHG